MFEFVLHFALGLAGSLLVFWLFFRLSDAESTSAPFALIFVALACGALAVQVSPWAIPVIIALYAVMSGKEYLEDKRNLVSLDDDADERQFKGDEKD